MNASKARSKDIALFCDVDMTLLPSMATKIHPSRRDFALELYNRLGRAFAFVTGRPGDSLDTTFPQRLPASVEHHSAWRPEQGGDYIPLAPRLKTQEMGQTARERINGDIPLFARKEQVLEQRPGVFVEMKIHSLAFVFSAGAAPKEHIIILKLIAAQLMEIHSLGGTHRIAQGSDAVEIVPSHLDKGNAVRQFMETPSFRGKKPVFIGDGMPDAQAMKVCAEEFGGYGIAVGDKIPDASYIQDRVPGVDGAWKVLHKMAPRCR